MPALSLVRSSGCYPQSLQGACFPRDIVNGAFQRFDLVAAASKLLTLPTFGTHLLIEGQLESDTVATETTLDIKLNGDVTGNHHWQRVGAQNGAATVGEGSTWSAGNISAASAVAGYRTSFSLFFPDYLGSRQKVCIISGSGELAAGNQRIFLVALKRSAAGVGALTDPLSTIEIAGTAGNITGYLAMATILRAA